MIEPDLYPGYVIYSYDVRNEIGYQHEGSRVTAQFFDVDVDPHNPEKFAATVTTTDGQVLIYFSDSYDTWPMAVRRLFRKHAAARRTADV